MSENKLPDIKHFTIRVYGIILDKNNRVLLSDEYFADKKITKFPGGGMEFGESPEDTLKREFAEEFNQDILVGEHFYTTDFFIRAYANPEYQLVSLYYFVKLTGERKIVISEKAHDKINFGYGDQTVRFENIDEKLQEKMSFPIDKKAAKLLYIKYGRK